MLRGVKGYRLLSSTMRHQSLRSMVTAPKTESVSAKPGTKSILSNARYMGSLQAGDTHTPSLTKPNTLVDDPYCGGLLAIPVPSKIDVYNTPSGGQDPIYQFPGAAFNPGFNSDGSVFVSWDTDKYIIYRWKLSSGEQLQPIKIVGNGLTIDGVTANADASLVAVSFRDFSGGTFQGSGIQLYKNDDPIPYNLTDNNGAFKNIINSVAFNPGSTLVVSGVRDDAFLSSWAVNALSKSTANKPKQKIFLNGNGKVETPNYNIANLVFDPTGNKLACGNVTMGVNQEYGNYTGFLIDLNDITHAIPLYVGEYWTNYCVAFSSDSKILATGGYYRQPPNNNIHAVTRLWKMDGTLINGRQLQDNNSPFFGRNKAWIQFLGFDNTGSSQRVISVDILSATDSQVRSCIVDGTVGSVIDQKPNILAFSYPNQVAKMKKENSSEATVKNKTRLDKS